MKEVGLMNKVTFPNACQLMRWYFHPVGFEATMDAPSSMVARLFDRASGETVIAVAGLRCSTVMNATEVELIIEAIEAELDSFVPLRAVGT
ncbi:DUF1652 domain-containing protein [Pseudomonas quasicaspiana]|uniref:DUF1652 domain-containing protein n=1 Tax=Pseudomonas quasicaspiana TaxID=2829821 RepID=UPI001267A409|nr:DUF1652 domain-containing protein [Pseudomonas quasicaspiana]MCD5978000.1 DUF1652 domain-containing protein [Pseudomonas quasicaspiana]MDG6400041.1 DUF1652 domain-containing protein [Pseudomonas quasicaspiana]